MAAEISDVVRHSLEEAFLEVAFRANRLKEWMIFSQRVYSLEASFSDFFTELRDVMAAMNVAGGMNNQTLQRLDGRWSRCRPDYLDLRSFSTGVRYINRSSQKELAGAAPSASGGGMPRVDISALVEMMEKVSQALTGRAMMDLNQHCVGFEVALGGLIADCRHILTRELDELCEMTIQLRMEFRPGAGENP